MQDGSEQAGPSPQSWSFVLRIWIEETAEEAGRASWRGHITHVRSGERQYVQTVGALVRFIGGYLSAAGVEFAEEPRPGSGQP